MHRPWRCRLPPRGPPWRRWHGETGWWCSRRPGRTRAAGRWPSTMCRWAAGRGGAAASEEAHVGQGLPAQRPPRPATGKRDIAAVTHATPHAPAHPPRAAVHCLAAALGRAPGLARRALAARLPGRSRLQAAGVRHAAGARGRAALRLPAGSCGAPRHGGSGRVAAARPSGTGPSDVERSPVLAAAVLCMASARDEALHRNSGSCVARSLARSGAPDGPLAGGVARRRGATHWGHAGQAVGESLGGGCVRPRDCTLGPATNCLLPPFGTRAVVRWAHATAVSAAQAPHDSYGRPIPTGGRLPCAPAQRRRRRRSGGPRRAVGGRGLHERWQRSRHRSGQRAHGVGCAQPAGGAAPAAAAAHAAGLLRGRVRGRRRERAAGRGERERETYTLERDRTGRGARAQGRSVRVPRKPCCVSVRARLWHCALSCTNA
jgi:hypothetical protein